MVRWYGRYYKYLALAALIVLVLAGCGSEPVQVPEAVGEPANPNIILATTTSTVDSGLLDELVPIFEQQTGYIVQVIAVGTGAALKMGERGDADVLLVHSPEAEQELVEAQAVVNYQLVMHNDFVLVGPESDQARVAGMEITGALQAISEHEQVFISRGDDSGTHKMELALWSKAGMVPEGSWYQESGSGMGQTLTIANDKEAYTLTDRATYLSLAKNLDLKILIEGDAALLNIYHVMAVNPQKYPQVNAEGAEAFIDFLLNPETQERIGDFRREEFGQALFYPDAGKAESELGL